MRMVLTNFGTTGDIQPFLALAAELRRHGHEPILACSPDYGPRIRGLGLAFRPIGADYQAAAYGINKALLAAPEIYGPLVHTTHSELLATPELAALIGQLRAVSAPMMEAFPQALDELRAVCREADVLVSGPLPPLGRVIHELTGMPFVAVRFSHFGGKGTAIERLISEQFFAPFWAEHGLAPIDDLLTSGANSPQLTLYAMSRYVIPATPNWPAHYHTTGFFFLDEDDWRPDPALTDFLAAGPPPVALTFGSLVHDDPRRLTDLILDAVERAGCRAIIQHGWSGLAERQLPDTVYAVGFVPHGWLFARVGCVVHHGGAGTTAATLRAGVPAVFVPHLFDQPVWAQFVHELGCAGPPIPYAQLTAERLAAAISATLATPRYARIASALGEKIRAEQGVQQARQLIEQLMYKLGLQPRATDGEHALDVQPEEKKADQRKQYRQQQRAKRRQTFSY